MISYSTQQINGADCEAVLRALNAPLITRGQNTVKFEEDLKAFTAARHAVTFSSATAALHGIMAYLARDQEIEVFTSPITFVATANAALYAKGSVRFVDIDPKTMNISVSALDRALETRKLCKKAVVVAVDYAGNPCDYDGLLALKQKHSFTLVSDAAHSLGSYYKGVTPDFYSEFTALSFHPVKSITTGEGGAILCHKEEEAEWLRRFRSSGVMRDGRIGKYDVVQLGYNYNMTDVQAALGSSQLSRLTDFINRRTEIAKTYSVKLLNAPLLLPAVTPGAKSAWHLYPIRIDDFKRRDEVLAILNNKGIGANVHYIPLYEFSLYKKLGITGTCPEADKAYRSEISIPCHPGMSQKDVEFVTNTIKEVLRK